jgi:hypothetical protein
MKDFTIKNQKHVLRSFSEGGSKTKNVLMVFAVLSIVCFSGITSASGQTNVIEDFESYTVATNTWLDPTTVPGSGWSRTGAGDPDPEIAKADWEVRCCSGSLIYTPGSTLEDDAIDTNSLKFLVLRRTNQNPPTRSDEITEFKFPVLVDGTFRMQINPKNGSGDPLKMALVDSGSGKLAMYMTYTESKWPDPADPPNNKVNSADFRVFDQPGNRLLSEIQLDGQPDSYHRWYDFIFTMHAGGTFDLEIIDIGPTEPTSITSTQVARGVLGSVSNIPAGVLGIDTFRLEQGPGNGGGEQPTMIDNIIITRSEGSVVPSPDVGTGFEIPYATVLPEDDPMAIYQPQVTDDLTTGIWTSHGPPVLGDGATKSALLPTLGASSRAYRIVVF